MMEAVNRTDRLVRNELYKAFRLKKQYLLMLMALAIEVAVALQRKFGSVAPNGQNFPLQLMDNLPYVFATFAVVFIADSWVDEYRSGAIKLPLLRPVNRTMLLNAKVISFLVCAAVLMGFTLLSAYVIGALTLGWGEKTDIREMLVTLASGTVILLPILGFGLLVLFIAIVTENMPITVGSAMGLFLFSQMLNSSNGIRNYSIIYIMGTFPNDFLDQFPSRSLIVTSTVTFTYIIVFYFASVLVFRKKDVLT